ncbi:Uncharacterised protein [Pandoraea pulmonicola]|uniref:Uncharacterized protein n=1 Tax=Pandoraea pulmonicola TaxID=93221 RepID=A0AAJ4ZGG9_PANPU|nr:Uncharacterised protein [Pandoraea pulmonicola]
MLGACAVTPYRAGKQVSMMQKSDELSQLWFFYKFFCQRFTRLGISLI